MSLASNATDDLLSAKSAIRDLITDISGSRSESEALSALCDILRAIGKVNGLRLSLALENDSEWDGVDPETSEAYREVQAEIDDQDRVPTLKKIDTSALETTLNRLAEMAKEFKAEAK